MKEQVVQTMAEAFFRYHAGRYATLPQLELLKQDINRLGQFGAIGITAAVGRDLDLFFYSRNTFHGMVERMRKPAIADQNKEDLFEQTLKTILMTVMLHFRTTPEEFTVKRYNTFGSKRWDIAKNNELLEAMVEGLRAKYSTIVLSEDKLSIFTGFQGSAGWVFRPPRYFNNIIRFPDITDD